MNDSESNSSPVALPNVNAAKTQQQQQRHHSSSTASALSLSSLENQHPQQDYLPITTTSTASPLLVYNNSRNHRSARNYGNSSNNNDSNTRMPEISTSSSSPFIPPPQERSNASSSSSLTATTTTTATATILDAPILDDYLLGHVLLSKLKWIAMELFHSIENNGNDDALGVAAGRYAIFLVSLLLYPAIHLATTLATHGQTPAVRILGLERKIVSNHNKRKNNGNNSNFTLRQRQQQQRRLVFFSLLTTLGPIILHAVKDALIRRQQQYQQRQRQRQLQLLVMASSLDVNNQEQLLEQEHRAARRQFQMASHVLQMLNRIVPLVQLAVVLQCWNNSSNTSELAMMLTGFTYQKPHHQHQQQQYKSSSQITPPSFSSTSSSSGPPPLPLTAAEAAVGPLLHVTYAHRRWLWDEIARTAQLWTRGLILFIPVWKPLLDGYLREWRHRYLLLSHSWSRTRKTSSTRMTSGKEEEHESIDNHDGRQLRQLQREQPCPICRAQPITVPVTADCCGHPYCYVCLYQESLSSASSGRGVACRICEQSISHCQRRQQ
jgi:hypothetical protein